MAVVAVVEGAWRWGHGGRGRGGREGGREAVHLAIKKLTQAARKVDLEKARRDIDLTSAKAHDTEPAPGFDVGALAGLRRNDQGRPVWVVPRAGQPLSMFDSSFWTSVDPLRFPYGDGVFGLERETELTYEQWCRCLMDREELVYSLEGGRGHGESDAGESDAVPKRVVRRSLLAPHPAKRPRV